jgi:hypothetical protein
MSPGIQRRALHASGVDDTKTKTTPHAFGVDDTLHTGWQHNFALGGRIDCIQYGSPFVAESCFPEVIAGNVRSIPPRFR